MASVVGFLSRNYQTFFPIKPVKEANALKFGILGAAQIAPIALVNPARSHPGVIVEAVAARDQVRAKAFAKKYGIPKTYATYQELVDDPTIDVIYNPLPPGLHYEWTMKSLKAGKHVLLEKPAANTAEEARKMFALAKEKNVVLLEAYHYRFHPVIQTIKSLVAAGKIGKVKGIESEMGLPAAVVPDDSFRRKLTLGGGSFMDMGGYLINLPRYVLGTEPTDMLHIQVNTYPDDKRVDRSIRAVYQFPNDVSASTYTDFATPKILGVIPRPPFATFKIDGDKGSIYVNDFMFSSVYHYITVTTKGEYGDVTETVKAYTFDDLDMSAKGENWWTTYRYMLEAFVDKIQGRTPQTWVTEEDTIANMKAMEMVFENSGLGVRPSSEYK